MLNRFEQIAAPMRIHHGAFLKRDFRSLPTDALLTVCSFSFVILKHIRKRMRQNAATTIIAFLQPAGES